MGQGFAIPSVAVGPGGSVWGHQNGPRPQQVRRRRDPGQILALGIIAAVNQLHIAQNVLNAVLYAALAALAGIAIVAVGGGGIKTMSQRWEAAAARFDAEMLRITAARNTPSLTNQASQAMPADPGPSCHEATGTRPASAEPSPQPDEESDHPTGS